MIVTCPSCSTKYNLPEDKVSAGMQLRCTVCQTVFPLPEGAAPEAKAEAASISLDVEGYSNKKAKGKKAEEKAVKKKSGASIINMLLMSIFLACAGGGAYYAVQYPDKVTQQFPKLEPLASRLSDSAKAFKLSDLLNVFKLGPSRKKVPSRDMISKIRLVETRQYTVENDRLGNILVIDGKLVNDFAELRELIRVEASLCDMDGNVLETKQQLAGVMLTGFQLQILGEQELEQALNNKLDIMSNNTYIQPGATVPVMVVFYNIPENAAQFVMKVIDAKMPPPSK